MFRDGSGSPPAANRLLSKLTNMDMTFGSSHKMPTYRVKRPLKRRIKIIRNGFPVFDP